ncbi:sulfatase-like hydrolase/transferase [Phycicoccus flavus]|uniref:sulfatase-like hydrolase/transferase n=1 Tax=Phycicoccus flavus TaxID=2502783 RepID=UPI000FEC11E4|nr:sulfatase-like hydrolase/transferase [Phycicoccus flavus]NHA67261.1 sulfatase-like hydrolase/transferase [Phycicoccus flavus]
MTDAPNILLMCTDQQRWSALRAAGNDEIDTPNLDRLAGDGVLFEQCYVQNPVCSPSRASLMTSQYVPVHGLHANGVDLDPDADLFSKRLADAGYDCGLVGKLHLGACQGGRTEPRVDDGFRVFRWAHDPYPGSSENAYHRWLQVAHPDVYDRAIARRGEGSWDSVRTEAHYSRWVGNETVDFLTRSRRTDRPFFFVANFFDPHHGFGAPVEYVERYHAESLSRPTTYDGELDSKPDIQAEASKRSYAGHAKGFLEYSDEEVQDVRAAYYAMVTLVDDEVGRILDTLEGQGLAENTIVVFTSDHGEMLGDHQLMLKGPFMYDCAVRVPLLVRWPGVTEAGRRVEELVQWVDLGPTFLDAAGVDVPVGYQGRSLRPLLAGEDDAGWRDWALCTYRDSGHAYDPAVHVTMLRHGTLKYVVHHGDPATARTRDGELYDLATDPDELTNLWHDPEHAGDRLRLGELLLDVLVGAEDRSGARLADW